MRIFNGTAELEQAAGTHLGYSEWHTITQEQVNQFAEATGDHQWIHLDPVRAAAGPYGTTIAHGYLTLSLLPMLASEVYRVDGLQMGINYGSNKVRFPAAVPVGSRVRAGVELLAVDRKPAGAQVSTRVTIEIEGGAKPACVAEPIAVLVD
ncbi:MaoC family dehydratase [Nocardia goodfellowii]|uniref:Acyl dehydratase n=1 Tax=Nocardia goodfellowii TaxID=882446 RepID=A0ABS4QMQ9_9NOCA|nr:MaoC family dehydratase [Nocardia goodfellowii]MBP2192823.1 acyl dehydratase [Nocardia goodfellowii]